MENEITVNELIEKVQSGITFFKTKLLAVILVGFLFGVAGYFYAYFKKPMYEASLSFALEDDKGGGVSGAMGIASQFGIDLGTSGGGAFSASNIIELFKSRSVVEKALLQPVVIDKRTTSLANFYMEYTGMCETFSKISSLHAVKFPPDTNRANFTFLQDSVLGEISRTIKNDNLDVSQKDKKVSIISVLVKSPSERFAKNFADLLVQVVSEFYIDTKSKKARMNVEILQRQLDSIKTELSSAITNVASSNDNTYGLNPAFAIKRAPIQRRQIDVQVNTAILTELVKNLELAKITLGRETPLIQLIDKPIYPLERQRVSKVKTAIVFAFGGSFVFMIILLLRRKKSTP